MDDSINDVMAITGAPADAARHILEMCSGDTQQAIQLWFEDETLQNSLVGMGDASSANASLATLRGSTPRTGGGSTLDLPGSSSSHGRVAQQQRQNATYMPSSDEEIDYPMTDDEGDLVAVNAAARHAQEDEDAAMAQRLQQELYAGQGLGADGVRAPMARTTETLVAPSVAGMGLYGGLDDDIEHVHQHMADLLANRTSMQARPAAPRNPFAQSLWDGGFPGSADAPFIARATHLADLFSPPRDLVSLEPWDDARDLGKEQKKWLLVNLQGAGDFHSVALNRDIWKHDAIKDMMREHFVFLQYSTDDPAADQYKTFYMPNGASENQDNFPHVAIIDPRTGEQVKVWSGIPFPSATDFLQELADFLGRYSLDSKSKNPVPQTRRPDAQIDVGRLTEEEMLEMALKNSLEGASGPQAGRPSLTDPDALTRPMQTPENVGNLLGNRLEPNPSPFSLISSTEPHDEPSHDAATTTRIQFRHRNGRVIRRFRLDDKVVRLYEWLKAAPLVGQDGADFEIKVIPGGRDVMNDVDKTIEQAGLKNATLVIEFL